jgi:hypothetical protein
MSKSGLLKARINYLMLNLEFNIRRMTGTMTQVHDSHRVWSYKFSNWWYKLFNRGNVPVEWNFIIGGSLNGMKKGDIVVGEEKDGKLLYSLKDGTSLAGGGVSPEQLKEHYTEFKQALVSVGKGTISGVKKSVAISDMSKRAFLRAIDANRDVMGKAAIFRNIYLKLDRLKKRIPDDDKAYLSREGLAPNQNYVDDENRFKELISEAAIAYQHQRYFWLNQLANKIGLPALGAGAGWVAGSAASAGLGWNTIFLGAKIGTVTCPGLGTFIGLSLAIVAVIGTRFFYGEATSQTEWRKLAETAFSPIANDFKENSVAYSLSRKHESTIPYVWYQLKCYGSVWVERSGSRNEKHSIRSSDNMPLEQLKTYIEYQKEMGQTVTSLRDPDLKLDLPGISMPRR